MAKEEKIINKIIPLKTIIEVANYLESQKEKYNSLFQKDVQKNQNLKFQEQNWEYKGDIPKVQYTIKFRDGREITEADYNWFMRMLDNLNSIETITFYSAIYYSSNIESNEHSEFHHLYIWVYFKEDSATIRVDGKNMEEQVYNVHSYLRGTIENNEDRYNKTIKHRKIRIQSFCVSIGFILSYIIYLILTVNKTNLPEYISTYLDNKMVIILGQWFISILIGNILGLPVMMGLYRNILPKAKYSHYSRSSHKAVYVDNIEDFTSHDEVQIGRFANSGKNRTIIEKIYKITSKVVLVQLAISILLFLII